MAQSTRATEYYGAVNYAPYDMFIPSKLGVTFGWKNDDSPPWEIEYLRGSVSTPFVLDDFKEKIQSRFDLPCVAPAHDQEFILE